MNSTPIELISTFRKKISFQTLIVLLLMAAMIITGFVFIDQAGKFSSAIQTGCFLLVPAGYLLFMRKRIMLKLLDPSNPEQTIENMQRHLHERMELFSSSTVPRLAFGFVCAIGMIFLLYYKPSSPLGASLGVILVFVVVMSMLIGWINMRDSIMLQDLKHCERNHNNSNYPSEIS